MGLETVKLSNNSRGTQDTVTPTRKVTRPRGADVPRDLRAPTRKVTCPRGADIPRDLRAPTQSYTD